MAESKDNFITNGLRGMIGRLLIFRQRGNKTIVSKAPSKRTTEPTENEMENRRKFKNAVTYAQAVLKNPEEKKEYEEKAMQIDNVSGYNLAIADLFHSPIIQQIDTSNYSGKIGSTISILATDDFKVASVSVKIENSNKILLEQGIAKQNNEVWIYTATTENPDISNTKITVSVSDLPGNISENTILL